MNSLLKRVWHVITDTLIGRAVAFFAGIAVIATFVVTYLPGDDSADHKPNSKPLVFSGTLTERQPTVSHDFVVELNEVVEIIPRPEENDEAYYAIAVGPEGSEPYCNIPRFKGSSGQLGNGLKFRAIDAGKMVLTVSAYSSDGAILEYGSYKISVLVHSKDTSMGFECREIK